MLLGPEQAGTVHQQTSVGAGELASNSSFGEWRSIRDLWFWRCCCCFCCVMARTLGMDVLASGGMAGILRLATPPLGLNNQGLGMRRRRKLGYELCIRASVTNTSSDQTAATPKTPSSSSPLSNLLNLPSALWQQVLRPLGNFGYGKRSVWEGGVGLFVISGAVLLAITLVWVKGKQIRAATRKYEAVFEFQQAQGITVGTPVRIRGVDVGNVVQVRPSLERIDVVVELSDTGIVVPRNALVEVNQSGLISETLIDVTPRLPLPKPTVGPLDPGCAAEGIIVCDRERIKGEQGVSLDELVGICTKIARQMDALGVDRMAGMAERLSEAVQDARPLLLKVQSMASDIEPLLKEVRQGGLLKDFENLTKVAAEAGRDLSNLNKSVLTSDNTELLRDSVSTLTKTLKHVESISKDVSGVTGDAKTRNNLKQLIESLSRLVTD